MWPMFGPIKAYAPIYMVGIVLHLVLALIWARKLQLRWYLGLIINACYLFGMIVGAKILFDLRSGAFSLTALASSEHWQRGGMWGGPLAYLATAVPLALLLAGNRRAGFDLLALTMPIPMLIAKVACLCNGCCYGQPTSMPWGIKFPAGPSGAPVGVPVHPTQIYEMLVLAAAAVVLARVNRPFWRGTLLLWFLAIYGAGRTATEFFRGDIKPEGSLGPLTHSQWLCLGVSAFSILALMIYRHVRAGELAKP